MIASAQDVNFSMWEGMQASASDAWRAGATSAIDRGVQEMQDDSEELTAEYANDKFGLTGTDAAVEAGTKITRDQAQARFNDYHKLKMNQFIQETVNEDSPVMGRVSQFVSGLAVGMADPVTMAANALGTGIIAKAGQWAANSAKTLTAISKVSPAAAKLVTGAYTAGTHRSLLQVVAREGMENLAGSVLEEGIIQSANIGEERLARKITFQESMMNVVTGTVFGTGLGTIMSSDGRKAIARKFSKDFGDDAAEMAKSIHTVTAEEMKMGIEKSGIESKFYDRDTFERKPWHKDEYDYSFTENNPKTLYLSKDDAGNLHSYSTRGDGVTLTDNKFHAMNKGSSVMEIDPSNLNLITREMVVDAKGRNTKLGSQIMDELVEDLVVRGDADKLGKIVQLLRDPDTDLDVKWNRNQARKMLKEELIGKNVDQMIDVLDNVVTRHQLDYDVSMKMDQILDKTGHNGYVYTGKNAQGNGAYNGVYVSEKFTKKLSKVREVETPKPSAGDKIIWQNQEQQLLHQHAEWLLKEAKPLFNDVKSRDYAGVPSETPKPEPIKSNTDQALTGTVEKQQKFGAFKQEVDAKVQAQLAAAEAKAASMKPAEGKPAAPKVDPEADVDLELLQQQRILAAIESGKSKEEIIDLESKAMDDYLNCQFSQVGGQF
jgi:hypothetical protein